MNYRWAWKLAAGLCIMHQVVPTLTCNGLMWLVWSLRSGGESAASAFRMSCWLIDEEQSCRLANYTTVCFGRTSINTRPSRVHVCSSLRFKALLMSWFLNRSCSQPRERCGQVRNYEKYQLLSLRHITRHIHSRRCEQSWCWRWCREAKMTLVGSVRPHEFRRCQPTCRTSRRSRQLQRRRTRNPPKSNIPPIIYQNVWKARVRSPQRQIGQSEAVSQRNAG